MSEVGPGTPPSLAVDLNGIALPTPVLAASGCFNTGREMSRLIDVKRMGGLVPKGETLGATRGAPAPRLEGTRSGSWDALGLGT